MHDGIEYNALSERVAFTKEVGDGTHIHQPIRFHNRTEYNALSGRAAFTKQVGDIAHPRAQAGAIESRIALNDKGDITAGMIKRGLSPARPGS